MNHGYTPHQLDPDEMLRTMPAGWDLSGMAPQGSLTPWPPAHLTSWPAQEDGLQPNDWQPEKFGSPHTTPRGWDVSNLR